MVKLLHAYLYLLYLFSPGDALFNFMSDSSVKLWVQSELQRNCGPSRCFDLLFPHFWFSVYCIPQSFPGFGGITVLYRSNVIYQSRLVSRETRVSSRETRELRSYGIFFNGFPYLKRIKFLRKYSVVSMRNEWNLVLLNATMFTVSSFSQNCKEPYKFQVVFCGSWTRCFLCLHHCYVIFSFISDSVYHTDSHFLDLGVF